MAHDTLAQNLFDQICRIPLIDPHSHLDPYQPTARSLDDILGYHYYTELAHSAGMSKAPLESQVPTRERLHTLLSHLGSFDNTIQYSWLVEIARTFLGWEATRLGPADGDAFCDAAEKIFGQPDWEEQVFRKTNLEKIFLTNEFDDPLTGFDTQRYVPCLRLDTLVFQMGQPEVRQRLAKVTGVEVGDLATLRKALKALFEHFQRHQARACAISLPPDFVPLRPNESLLADELRSPLDQAPGQQIRSTGIFWLLTELCRQYDFPFDLMIGASRRVYPNGVYQGQDLFDQRVSLIDYAGLFNAFPEVTFCVSVVSSGQNQELASFSWIFPNVVTSGHWWYSNIPAYIERDAQARLQSVPKIKQIGYYSDAYRLEFVLPKFAMYRRILAHILARDFVRPGIYSENQAVEVARLLLHDNAQRIFGV